MLKLKNLLILTVSLVATTACNNQRSNRLSALNSCNTTGVVDPTAFTLTEKQMELFDSVDPVDFPDDEALVVKSIVSTFTIELENEEKAVVRLSNSNVQGTTGFPVVCAGNLTNEAVATRFVDAPVSNENGQIKLRKFKIEIGNPTREDQSDFLRVTAVNDDPVVEENSEAAAEPAPPVPFSNYFSLAEDEVAYYKVKENKDKPKTEEERLKQDYFIHYKNDAQQVRSRITVSRALKAEKK